MGAPKVFDAGGVWTELEFGEDGEARFSGELPLYLPHEAPARRAEVPTWQRVKTAEWLYRAAHMARALRAGATFLEMKSDRFDVCTRITFMEARGFFVFCTAREAPWPDGDELDDALSTEPWAETFWNDLVEAAARQCEPLPLPADVRRRLNRRAEVLEAAGLPWNTELFDAIEAGRGAIEATGGEISPLVQRTVWATKTGPHRAGGDASAVWSGGAFPGCSHPPAQLLTLDLGAPDLDELGLPDELRAWGTLPIVFPSCGGCDAWMLRRGEMVFDVRDGRLQVADGWALPSRCNAQNPSIEPEMTTAIVAAERPALPGAKPTGSGSALLHAALKWSHERRNQELFRLGGSPVWLQSHAKRPTAEGEWWFLGQRNRGANIYVFAEPARRQLALTMQVS